MKNKIDSDGILARHSETNFLYKNNKWFYAAAVMEDCFDDPAYYFGAGREFWSSSDKSQYIGILVGLYIRRSENVTGAPGDLQHGSHDYLPFPFIVYSKTFPVLKTYGAAVSLGTNIYVTHLTIGMRYLF